MVRRRSLRRRSIKKSLRSRRRSERSLRASYRFGAEQEKEKSLISAFVQIATKDPKAAASIIKLGFTALLQKYDVKEPGAIDMEEYNREVEPLHEFLNWDLAKGPGPVPKSVKFGVVVPSYLLDMREARRVAKKKKLAAAKKKKKPQEQQIKKKKHTIINYTK
jgi:hypothetical protein